MSLEILGMPIPDELTEVLVRAALAAIYLVLLIMFSKWQSLNMEKDYLIAFARAFIQLMLIALILDVLFELGNILLLFAVLVIMSLLAAYSSYQQFPQYPGIFRIQVGSDPHGHIAPGDSRYRSRRPDRLYAGCWKFWRTRFAGWQFLRATDIDSFSDRWIFQFAYGRCHLHR